MGRMRPDIAICVDSTPGCDLTSHTPPSPIHTYETYPVFLSPSIGSRFPVLLACRVSLPFRTTIFSRAHLIFCRPHVHFHCDVDFDPFTYLRENNKTYGAFLTHTVPIRHLAQLYLLQGLPYRCTTTGQHSQRCGLL